MRFGLEKRIVVNNRNKVLRWMKELAKIGVLECHEVPLKKGNRIYYRIGIPEVFSEFLVKESPIPCEEMFASHPVMVETIYSTGAYALPVGRQIKLKEMALVFSRRLCAAKLALSDRHVKGIESLLDNICEKEFEDPCKIPELPSITGTNGQIPRYHGHKWL